jgi:lysophospholipase L1-like esterase
MKKIVAVILLSVCAFGAGTIFQRQIGVGVVLVDLGLTKPIPSSVQFGARFASLDGLQVKEGSIVFVGDSLVNLQEWSEAFSDSRIVNRGISGARIRDVTGRYDIQKARAVFCLVGVNDLASGSSYEEFKVAYQKLIDSIPTEVALHTISIPAALKYGKRSSDIDLIARCNEYIKKATKARGGEYIDIFSISKSDGESFFVTDQLHFSTQGYQKIIAVLKPYIKKTEPNQ